MLLHQLVYFPSPLPFSPPSSSSLLSSSVNQVTSSQPVTAHSDGVRGESEGVDGGEGEGSTVESFTQPSRFDELIVGTQVPCTPGASQVSKGRWSGLGRGYCNYKL